MLPTTDAAGHELQTEAPLRWADLDEELGHVTEVQRDAPSLDRFQPGYGLITWLVLLHGWIGWSA